MVTLKMAEFSTKSCASILYVCLL